MHLRIHTHIYIHIHIYLYMYKFIYMYRTRIRCREIMCSFAPSLQSGTRYNFSKVSSVDIIFSKTNSELTS